VSWALRRGRAAIFAAAGKTGRWGPDGYNPELPPEDRETNEEWLERELDDLDMAIAQMREWIERRKQETR